MLILNVWPFPPLSRGGRAFRYICCAGCRLQSLTVDLLMLKNRFAALRFGSPVCQRTVRPRSSFRPQGLTTTTVKSLWPRPVTVTGLALAFQPGWMFFRWTSLPRSLSFGFWNASFDLCYRQIYTPSPVKAMQSAA